MCKYKLKLSTEEKELLDKCIDYYNNVYPTNKLVHDLSNFPHTLTNVIQFLYKFQNIYVTRSKKEDFNESSVQIINLEKALQMVKLPSFKSNKMITLSTHKIDKSSLQSHELDLLDTIEDYYKGYCPKQVMIKKLQNYSYNLQQIIRYLYQT